MASFDVLVLGAGAAGLAAARVLSEHGLSIAILEARDRIGGRILTLRPADARLPVELGAEFVHGRPRETFEIARAAGLTLYELGGAYWMSDGGRLSQTGDDDGMDTILGALSDWDGEDQPFQTFLDKRFPGKRWAAARRWASRYVEGFDAAYPDQVSVQWLRQTEAASASIDGERQFRLLDGYDRLLGWLRDGLRPERTVLSLDTVVHEIRWAREQVVASARSPLGTPLAPFTAPAAVITLPLGVLAAPPEAPGAVRFTPDLPEQRAAIAGLAMGEVVKVVLRFREVFWDAGPTSRLELARLSFLFSGDALIPTWWTSYPLLTPMLTGWVGGPRATRLAVQPDADIAEQAMEALARVLGVPRGDLESRLDAWHIHNWSADPFSRGAYSFVRAGGLDAPGRLAGPVDGTLFFAGEATDTDGHTGTVHAALATGQHAAEAVLAHFARGV